MPVPHAWVSVYDSEGELHFGESDDSGRYGFVVPTGTVGASIAPLTATLEYLWTDIDFEIETVPFERDLHFLPTNVRGPLTSPAGAPVAGLTTEPTPTTGPPGPAHQP